MIMNNMLILLMMSDNLLCNLQHIMNEKSDNSKYDERYAIHYV